LNARSTVAPRPDVRSSSPSANPGNNRGFSRHRLSPRHLAVMGGGRRSLALLQNPAHESASTPDRPQLRDHAVAEGDSHRFGGRQTSRTHALVSDKLRAGSVVSGIIKGEPDLVPCSIKHGSLQTRRASQKDPPLASATHTLRHAYTPADTRQQLLASMLYIVSPEGRSGGDETASTMDFSGHCLPPS
jgi:hypothetical protein